MALVAGLTEEGIEVAICDNLAESFSGSDSVPAEHLVGAPIIKG